MIASDILLVLASGSPRRREFMEVLALPFITVIPTSTSPDGKPQEVDETPLPDEAPSDLVQRLSQLKATAVLNNLSSSELPATNGKRAVVIAADTVVVLGKTILGKPGDPDEAKQMLQALRQDAHQVYTGFTVAVPPHVVSSLSLAPPPDRQALFITRLHTSTVWMRSYTDLEIERYIASGDPLDKAGAYGIQNKSFAPVARLEGCFASVMGLPLADLADALRSLKLSLPPIGSICSKHTGQSCCRR